MKKKILISVIVITALAVLDNQSPHAQENSSITAKEVYVSEEFNSARGGMVLYSENVTIPSSVSAEFINRRLAGTEMAGLGQAFKNAEAKYGVNAIFLTGLAIHESNYGKSMIAQAKNNLFGFMAYDSSPFSSAGYFESFEAGIDHVARYLGQHYLKQGGQYYNGTSIAAINVKYATDQEWAVKIMSRIRAFLAN